MWISRFHIEKFDFEFRLDIVKFVYEHICTIVLTVLYCLFVNIYCWWFGINGRYPSYIYLGKYVYLVNVF